MASTKYLLIVNVFARIVYSIFKEKRKKERKEEGQRLLNTCATFAHHLFTSVFEAQIKKYYFIYYSEFFQL